MCKRVGQSRLHFKHHKHIGTRLACGFGIVVVLTLLLGVVAIHAVRETAQMTLKMHKHPLVVGNAVRDIQDDIHAIQGHMKEVVPTPSDTQMEAVLRGMSEHEQDAMQAFRILAERFLGDQNDVKIAQEAFHDWQSIGQEVIELMLRHRPDAASDLIQGQGARQLGHLDECMQSISDSAGARAEAFFKRVEAFRKHHIWLMSFLLFLISVFCMIVGILITQSITEPIRHIVRQIGHIAGGDFDIRIDLDRCDELGRLGQAFNEMTDDLKETTISRDKLDTTNEKLLNEIDERIKAQEDSARIYQGLEEAHEELKNMQSQVIQNAKLASIGQLAAGVAHEMNTPVGFVASNFETLNGYVKKFTDLIALYEDLHTLVEKGTRQEQLDLGAKIAQTRKALKIDFILEDIHELFSDSTEGLERVVSIVQNLRDFSRVDQAEEFGDFDLNEGIKATLTVARNAVKYDAEVETELGNIPPVPCSSGQINQVLLNIVVNGAQAIKAQGRDEMGTITIKTYATETDVVCEISDNGPGIPEDTLAKIFDPFFTTKAPGQGTGLGLSVSYDIIVNKHHGQLLVDSTAGQGTMFTIKLPVQQRGSMSHTHMEKGETQHV